MNSWEKDGGVGRKEEWRPTLETGDILVRREGGGDLPTFQSQDDRQVKQPLLYYRGESNRTNQSLDVKRLFVFFCILYKLKSQLHSGGGHEVHNSEAVSEFETNRVRSAGHRVRCLWHGNLLKHFNCFENYTSGSWLFKQLITAMVDLMVVYIDRFDQLSSSVTFHH